MSPHFNTLSRFVIVFLPRSKQLLFSWQKPLVSKKKICINLTGWIAQGTLVSQLRIKPTPPAVGAWSLFHWTAREALQLIYS